MRQLVEPVSDVFGVFEYGSAGYAVLGLQHDVLDAHGGVLGQVGRFELAGDSLLPAKPPRLAELPGEVDLAAAFPIDVDGAQCVGAKDPRIEPTARVGKQEHGVSGRGCEGPSGELRQFGSVEMRIVDDAT